MPRNKVSGYCYKEFREEFNTSDKKNDILSFPFCSALDRTTRCAIHIRNSCCGLAYILTGLDFHDVSLRGRQKLALAKQVWELNKKAVLFSERKGCFTAVSHRINPDCQKEFFSQQCSQRPHQSFAYISFNRFHPSSVSKETICSINLVRFSVRTKRT